MSTTNELEKTLVDTSKGTERGQKAAKKVSRLPKTHQDYWQSRLKKRTYQSGGRTVEIPTWQVRLKHLKREGWFNLDTSNKVAAAAKARDIYLCLISQGWDVVNAKYKPEGEEKKEGCTIGEYLDRVKGVGELKPVTFQIYAKKFRSLVAAIFKIDGGKAKFDYVNGGNSEWLERIHKIQLGRLTPEKVNEWRGAYLTAASGNPLKHKRAHISANSILRCGKALFTENILEKVALKIPKPLPFDGVKNPKLPRSIYQSEIDPATLLQDARIELGEAPGDGAEDKHEMYKIILLALGVGMRRDEIDTLQCRHLIWQKNLIRIEVTEHGGVKTDDSQADVAADPALMDMLKKFLPVPAFGASFVIKSNVKPRPGAVTYRHYRCNRLFKLTNKWLRSKGITSNRAIHTLRKEFGSQINDRAGIYAASQALRHSDIRVTTGHYIDGKKKVSVFPMGEMMGTTNVEQMPKDGIGKK